MCALLVALAAFAGPNDSLWQERAFEGNTDKIVLQTAKVSTRLQGFVFRGLIHEGMKMECVDLFLNKNRCDGEDTAFDAKGKVVRHTRLYSWLGINISYLNGRVHWVTYEPFLPFEN